jgi:hypothetical protein
MVATKKLTANNSTHAIGGDLGVHELSVAAKGVSKHSLYDDNN